MLEKTTLRDDFEWVYSDQPHTQRRNLMLKKYPVIKTLMGADPNEILVVTSMVFAQVLACYFLQDSSWLTIILMAYIFGGTINHSLTLAIHDIGHNTAFGAGVKNAWKNRYFGFLANLPLGVPYSVTFKKYHIDHHRYLAGDGLDTDLPTEWEGNFFTNGPLKLLWLFLNPLFYAFRPMIVRPKTPTHYEFKNWIVQIIFNVWIYQSFGGKAMAYLLIGTFLSLGVHPIAGHFIAEHYMFVKGVDTFSYYGPLNMLTFNVGYHNEHHDFPFIPASHLPELRKIAPEYYEEVPQLESWIMVLYDYVMDPQNGPFNRVRRKFDVDGKVVKPKEGSSYNDEHARLGKNSDHDPIHPDTEQPNSSKTSFKPSSNVIAKSFLHASRN